MREEDLVAALGEARRLGHLERDEEALVLRIFLVRELRRAHVRQAAAVEVEGCADVLVARQHEDRAARAMLGDEAGGGARQGEGDDQDGLRACGGLDHGLGDRIGRIEGQRSHLG